jgi:DNA-binding response OmpR family regulator
LSGLKAPDLATAIAVTGEAKISPDGLLVDYHLDDGSGVTAIKELRRRFGAASQPS